MNMHLNRRGFTLVELLVVMVIIAVLASIVVAGAQYVVHAARRKRLDLTCQALSTALHRYRTEYGQWPLGGKQPDENYIVSVSGDSNKEIFDMLRENHPKNTHAVRFLDESTLFTVYQGTRMPLHQARLQAGSTALPLVYVEAESGRSAYFKVSINVDADTASVSGE